MKKLIFLLFAIYLSTLAGNAYAQDELVVGMNLLDRHDCTGALEHLIKAVNRDPKSEKANLYLGNTYLCLGNLDSAAIFFNAAVNLKDDYAAAYFGLGEVYFQQKKFASAIDNLKEAINYDPKNLSYELTLGKAYLQVDSLDMAMGAFYKARDMNDKSPLALEGIGDVYSKQNIFDPAIENYKEALQIDSNDISVRLKLANAYMKNNDGGDAYEQFLIATKLDSNNADAQYQAGELLYINKRYREAFPFLSKYHELKPNDDKTLLQLANAGVEGHFYPEAVKAYQEYLAKYPNSSEAKKSLGAAYYFEKQPTLSYNTYKSVPIDSMNVRELVRFGLAANAVHDTATAIDAWSRAVKIDTTLSEIENLLANTLFGAKRYNDAIIHFQRHLTMEPNDPTAELNMGLCYFIIQDYPNAIAALRRVLAIRPENYQGTIWLARALVFADSLGTASDEYDSLIAIAKSDTGGGDHSSDLNEAYRQKALYQVISGTKIQKDHPDDAKKLYEAAYQNLATALKYDSKELKTHELLAQDYALMGKIDDACKEIKTVLRSEPHDDQMLKLQKSLGCE